VKRLLSKEHLASWVILFILLSAWAIFHVWTRHMNTELGYKITSQQALKQRLMSDNMALRLEISTLKSSKRLEHIAKDELGMNMPKPEQVVYLWLDE